MNKRWKLWTSMAVFLLAFVVGCAGTEPDEDGGESTDVAVEVAPVVRMTLRSRVDAYGTVEPAPAGGGRPGGVARLAAPAPGIVAAVAVEEGGRIEAGTIVVILDDRIEAAQLDKAQHALQFAEQRMVRENALDAVEGTSQKAIAQATQQLAAARADVAAAQGALALVRLTSPIAGVVALVNVQPGQTVDPNTVVAEIVDPAHLVMTLQIPVAEATAIAIGQTAELVGDDTAPSAPGKVVFVSPQVDRRTATVLVRASTPGSSDLRPGRFVHVRIVVEERLNRLAVPRAAVYTDHDGRSTLSVVKGTTAMRRPVTIGLQDGDFIEVEGAGLVEGATVVTLGSYALPDETKVHVQPPAPISGVAR